MSKNKKDTKVKKIDENIVVPEVVIEPIIEVKKELSPEELKLIKNKERVLFSKPSVKQIVSPHSGSILSEPVPVIPHLDEELEQISRKAFESLANDNVIIKTQIPELLQKTGFPYDINLLKKIVEEFYINTTTDTLTIIEYLEFVHKFYAPAYYYGERLRRNVCRGQKDAIQSLLLRNCDVNTSDGERTSSLHYCCEFNRTDIIMLLSTITNDKLIINAKDRYGWTPLHSASHQGNKECVQLLINLGANVNIINNIGKSPLHLATMQNRGNIIELLLNANANIDIQDNQGMTAIHEAAYRGQFVIYNDLIRNPKANLLLRDSLNNLASDYYDE